MNIQIKLREEGGLVTDGASLTNMPTAARLHITYRQTLASGMVQLIHFAVPRENSFDLSRWCVSDEVHDPTDFTDWYDK